MAEIKSSLELALERTGKLSISEKEREEIKQREAVQKAAGLANRYLEDQISLNEVLREIERSEKHAAETVRRLFRSRCIDSLGLDDRGDKVLKALEALDVRNLNETRSSLEKLRMEYRRERTRCEEETRQGLNEKLRDDGISGSAVVPNVEGSAQWKRKMESLDTEYRRKTEGIRQTLRNP